MNNNSPLVNLSLLECLQGKKRADELDLFIPFLADILEEINKETIDKIELQDAFKVRFKIITPLEALNTLLTRAKNLGLLAKHNKQYFVQFEKVGELTKESKNKKAEINASITLVVESFIVFAKEEFGETIEYCFAEESLYEFIRNNISVFADNVDGNTPDTKTKIKNKNYLMASFIKYAHEQKKSLIPEISRIVKGTLLANYLTFADKTSQKDKFNNITVYLDTPIILGLLGWDGPTRKRSLQELLDLIVDLRAKISVFDVTVREIRGVLAFWMGILRNGEYHKLHEMTRQLFKSRAVTPAQINTESVLLESNLSGLGIEIDNNFELDEKYCCDENKLEKFLRRVGFKRPKHDVTCISRVFNSRAGKSINSLNEEFSVFITPNKSIEAVSNRFFKQDIEANSFNVVASEKWLATFLWLKHPEHFASLPFDMLLTDAYSALNSDDHFWESFLKRLQNLKSKGSVTEDDFNLVRWNNSLFTMVQHASVLGGDEIAEDDIYAIVEEIKAKHLDEKNQEINVKDQELCALNDELCHTSAKLTKTINSVSVTVAGVLVMTYGLLWVIGMYNFGPSLSAASLHEIDNRFVSASISVGFFVVFILALAGAIGGGIKLFKLTKENCFSFLVKKFFLNK